MPLDYINLDDLAPEDAQPREAITPKPQQAILVDPPTAQPIVQPIIQVQQPAPLAETNLFTAAPQEPKITSMESATQKANEVVTEVFGQALVHTVKTDDGVRQSIVGAAKQVIESKSQTIVDQAMMESTAQTFKRYEDACSGFGYEEKTTPESLVKQMSVIAYFWGFLYIWTIGFFLVFPVTFFFRKIKVVIKQTWLAFIFALLVYLAIVFVPILVAYVKDWIT